MSVTKKIIRGWFKKITVIQSSEIYMATDNRKAYEGDGTKFWLSGIPYDVEAEEVVIPNNGEGTATDPNAVHIGGDLVGSPDNPQLTATGATPGVYTNPTMLVNDEGRITSISSQPSLRTIFFMIKRVPFDGPQVQEIKFPQNGTIKEVYASLATPNTRDLIIKVQKVVDADYTPAANWTEVCSLTIQAGSKASGSSGYSMSIPSVVKNDHYRISVFGSTENMEGLTVQVVVDVVA